MVSPEERPVSLNSLFAKWNKTFESFDDFEEIRLLKVDGVLRVVGRN